MTIVVSLHLKILFIIDVCLYATVCTFCNSRVQMMVSIFLCVAFGLDRYCNLCANHSFSKQRDLFSEGV